ncbi:MAG: SUMF1/EgtB/PvdO family nonheme iron enzyme [Nitrospira sp.]|nr:SUMF1/EgtB/PvdO family nonheme iron enzyme [Nitrospira sp.]
MINRQPGEVTKERLPRPQGRLPVAGVLLGGLLLTLNPSSPLAQGTAGVPERMAYVPFGPAIMGIDKDPADAGSVRESATLYQRRMSMPWSKQAFHDEGPAHWVVLDGFFIDKFEVSNSDFAKFMKEKGHPGPAYWDDPRLNKPDQPVVGVNWFDAKAYCKYKGKRLPTEAEWERAARGPEGFQYPWGNEFDPAKANYGKNHEATLPVDSMPEAASPYGLHHMAGNVFEWVEDWYDPDFYKKTPHPVNTQGPLKPIWIGGTGTYVDRLTVGAKRVVRGGSWIAAESSITTTHRFWNHPANNSYGVGLGFRCAQTASHAVNDKVRTATINAMRSMGQEKWQEAKKYLDTALGLDPHNTELQQMQEIVQGKI